MWSRCVPDARRVVRCDAHAQRSLTKDTTLVDVENAKPRWLIVSSIQPFLTKSRCSNQLNIEYEHYLSHHMRLYLVFEPFE